MGDPSPEWRAMRGIPHYLSGIAVILIANSLFAGLASGADGNVLVLAGDGQSTARRAVFADPLRAVVRDGEAKPIPNIRVRFSGPTSGAGCDFGGGATEVVVSSDDWGIVSARCVATVARGSFSVRATVGESPQA